MTSKDMGIHSTDSLTDSVQVEQTQKSYHTQYRKTNSNTFRKESKIHPMCWIKQPYPCSAPHQSLKPHEKVSLKLGIFYNSASKTEEDTDTLLQVA